MNSPIKGSENLESMSDAKNYNAHITKKILKWLPYDQPILDFGAGTGLFPALLESKYRKIVCVEKNLELSKTLNERGFETYTDLDAPQLDGLGGIYTLNVLEHIVEDEAVLKSLAEILSPGGRILIYVPAHPWLFSSMDRRVSHVRRYQKTELINKVTSSNLRIINLEYVDFLGVFATLVFKLVGNRSGKLNRRSILFYDRLIFPLSALLDRLFCKLLGKNLLLVAEK
jgi:SAM-dependent methyltransferase